MVFYNLKGKPHFRGRNCNGKCTKHTLEILINPKMVQLTQIFIAKPPDQVNIVLRAHLTRSTSCCISLRTHTETGTHNDLKYQASIS